MRLAADGGYANGGPGASRRGPEGQPAGATAADDGKQL
jgi:hypothetical protein